MSVCATGGHKFTEVHHWLCSYVRYQVWSNMDECLLRSGCVPVLMTAPLSVIYLWLVLHYLYMC